MEEKCFQSVGLGQARHEPYAQLLGDFKGLIVGDL